MPSKAKPTSAPPSEDAIRHRAYLLWEADGRPDGMADHYWLRASEPAADARPKRQAAGAPAVKAKSVKEPTKA